MSVKKNLTVATLAALLAVPAFGTTNASHALHMPSVTAHAANVASQGQDKYSPYLPSNFDSRFQNSGNGFYKNGHFFNVENVKQQMANGAQGDLDPIITGIDGNNNVSNAQVLAALKGNSAADNQSNANSDSTNSSMNNLPQTGESNNSKAMAMGAVTLGASASLMALSIAKKHKQDADLETVTPVEPAINNGDGKGNTESNADKSVYHMIMGDTFKSISNDLK